MARGGRELEKLISIIERSLAGTRARVKSPDYIPDVDSGQQREVDVSIRFRTGSVEVIVVVECRDRAAMADVVWIEQLISKKRSIKADKMIAVSVKEFTKPALKKAQKERIETRILKKIKPKDVKSWVSDFNLSMSYLRYKTLGGKLEIYSKPDVDHTDAQIEWYEVNGNPRPVFLLVKSNTRLNIAELFEYLRLKDGLQPTWSFPHPPMPFWSERWFDPETVSIETSKGLFFVSYVKVGFEVEVDTTALALKDGYEYTSQAEHIARHMKFSGQLKIEGKPLNVVISTTIRADNK